jgi:hypothetical protein
VRNRYAFKITLEVPGANAADAIERALRLFRPQVRANLKQSVAYVGAYRGSWFAMGREKEPPEGRVNLQARRRKLRTLPREAKAVPVPAPVVVPAANPAEKPRRSLKPIKGTQRGLFAGMEVSAK